MVNQSRDPLAVYVHVPFCPSKCGYCDFNSYAMEGEIVGRTVDATVAEIERSPMRGRPAKTIFFGGGTPTFIPTASLLRILEAVVVAHPPVEGCEITSEANPGTVDASKFADMREGGFNRVSLGAQSFLDSDLIALGRIHHAGEIERAVNLARKSKFESLNLDLMFALPKQSRKAWEANMDRALALDPDHLSLYCLTIEPNTAFYKENLKGRLDLPDDESQVAMYEACCQRMIDEGYFQYEISNFARKGHECRHNLEYWHGCEYAGYGPGAVGSYELEGSRIRATNLKHPVRYCEAVESGEPLAFEREVLNEDTLRVERIMLGLRLNQGIGMDGLEIAPKKLAKMLTRGWLEVSENRMRLTEYGRHFCSEVVLELI
ncbi:MAG TPA: radical SAM family heme chaperone HemW [Fimbriimonas sp.]|nr:radical SAM family heme chaperone HemW [Fimbriimonas sp.]